MNTGSEVVVSGTPGPAVQAGHPGDMAPGRPSSATAPAAPLTAVAAKPGEHVARLAAAGFGALSIALYALLFWFDEELLELAQSTRRGDKRFFFVPIGIALLFSFVHGAFTGRFWDVLGLKARA